MIDHFHLARYTPHEFFSKIRMIMPNVELVKETETKVKLTITVPADELTPFLEEAAKEISKDAKIPGFRPGHAPYAEVVKKVGEGRELTVMLWVDISG